MPIIIPADYEPKQEKIESEQQLVELIQDVRTSISELDFHFGDKLYEEVLKIIEEQKAHDIHDGGLSSHSLVRIDLTQAEHLIHGYRNGSEGGCGPCRHFGSYMPMPDETALWCGKHENVDDIADNNNRSPLISKYLKTGCPERDLKFKRTVEEVLADVQAHGLAALVKQK